MTRGPSRHKPNYVYRCWDSYGHLLYIGCSVDPRKRMRAHAGTVWYRYCETVSVVGPWPFDEARRRETEAINTEASYFNVTQAQADAKKRCIGAAKRALYARNDFPMAFDRDLSLSDDGDRWYYEEYAPYNEAWDRRKCEWQARLKATTFPYMDEQERRTRYLVAREDAEAARLEAVAS